MGSVLNAALCALQWALHNLCHGASGVPHILPWLDRSLPMACCHTHMLQGKLSRPAVVCVFMLVCLPVLPVCICMSVHDQVHLKPDVPAARYPSVCPRYAAYGTSCLHTGSNDPPALCCGHVPGSGCHKPSVDAARLDLPCL